MHTAGIKDIKNNLSRYLERVKSGEEILITDRGKPIARIVKEDAGNASLRSALNPLIQKGLVVMPSHGLRIDSLPKIKTGGKPASDMVMEDRR